MHRPLAAVLLSASTMLPAAEFSARVIDNLGQPVPGATVTAYCYTLDSAGRRGREHKLFAKKAGPDGIIRGTYTESPAPCEKRVDVRVDNDDYTDSHYESLRGVYVLKRQVQAEELNGIVRLTGAELRLAMRNFLTSQFVNSPYELAFRYQDRLLPTVRTLANDPDAAIAARSLLAFLGIPEDVRLIASSPLPGSDGDYRWLYGVTCSLLTPSSDAEWDLLRKAALGGFDDNWVTRGAIQSLQLIASPRSRQILEEVRQAGSFGSHLAVSAIEYIDSNPPRLQDGVLSELGRRVGRAIASKTWNGNTEPRYNDAGDKALINLDFETPSDRYIYTAVFHLLNGTWTLRGVSETMQAMKAPPLMNPVKPK